MPFFVKVIAASNPNDLGKKFMLNGTETTVGRIGSNAHILLDSQKLSKHHCSFLLDTVLSVEDKNSSNGVFVNGKRVSQTILTDKDRVVIGEITMEVGKE